MLIQLAKLERRFLELESLLSRPDVVSNPYEFRKLSKERADLEHSIDLYRQLKKLDSETADVKAIQEGSSGEMAELAFAELQVLGQQREALESALRIELLPKDPNDGRNVFLEIRAGAGGDEACLFVAELFRMYMRFSETRRWRFEIVTQNETGLGGLREAVALIEGDGVYRMLKHESGVHRVQRVPETEAQGRVHTSTVTVAILPEADEVEVSVNDSDLRIDTYRAGGAGGQHVNRTDSAVRLTHLPTGIVVCCQDERSQIKNRAKAMKVLKSKLLEKAQIEQEKALSEERRAQVGRGDRSERIRTYNFPQSRVTDHRINYSTHDIGAFMEGDIVEVIERLRDYYQAEALGAQARGE